MTLSDTHPVPNSPGWRLLAHIFHRSHRTPIDRGPGSLPALPNRDARRASHPPLQPRQRKIPGLGLAALLLSLLFLPHSLWACAACYGQSDSPLARGMNWGIMSLLGVTLLVLGGVAAFFVCLARRAAAVSATGDPGLAPGLASVSRAGA